MRALVVMGVSGCGKSHIGAAVAAELGLPLVEGDDHHSDANRQRMREGVPLSDADRADWLARLGAELARRPGGAVLTCSALRRAYREQLRGACPGLGFAWLDLDTETAHARVAGRPDHFFPMALVATQFLTLEPPLREPQVLRLDARLPPAALVPQIVRWWQEAETDSAATARSAPAAHPAPARAPGARCPPGTRADRR
jgi:gluconokinase